MKKEPPDEALRVLFPFVGDSVGGSHISAVELIRELPNHGVIPIVTLNTEGVMADYLYGRNIPYLVLKSSYCLTYAPLKSQLGSLLTMVCPLLKFIREHRIDIVHTNDARMHQTWTLPVKLSNAAHLWHQRVATKSSKYALSALLADRIVTISDYCLSRLPAAMSRRTNLVYNPLSIPELSEAGKCRTFICQEMGASPEVIISFVANLSDRKRVRTFLQVAERFLCQSSENTLFPIFGDSSPKMRAALEEELTARRFNGRCRLLGRRYPIEPWIAACDILVAPARNEGFGRTLVEAMLCDTLVIASDEGGHREIVTHGETGYLVAPDDPDAFVRAIKHVMGAPEEAKAMKERAKKMVRQRFSAESHATDLVQIYASMLKRTAVVSTTGDDDG